jgi:hypothetical protein
MNSKIKTLIAAASLVFAIGGAASSASAATTWQDHHPRRVEVNTRLERQNLRIREERRMHLITAAQAHRLHVADHRTRLEERRMARRDGGHLTRVDQMRLNHRENRISHRIG